jgi:(4S)-4-hydroxy-5-phosphonooxypentane-2,3-dione isomerase
MYVVCVTAFVKAPNVAQFIEATLENARQTRKEAGNVRFDVLQAEEDPSRFFLYETYRSKEDFTTHQQTPHYLKWKQTVADLMREPRQGVRHKSIFFDNSEQ